MITENIFEQYLLQFGIMLVIFFGMDAIAKKKINVSKNIFICACMSFYLMVARSYEIGFLLQFLLVIPLMTILIILSSILFKNKQSKNLKS
jgi:alpha-D-ribose 1-methylphosphonate 5-triphosphate synthase subunit PhnL